MSELYPDDAALLALESDPETGVEYIPTGRSPYYLEFRKLIQRLLDASRRANDLRVYADGSLSVGVRAGRCVIANAPIDFTGATGTSVTDDAVSQVWIDGGGDIVIDTGGFPSDRTMHIPLAEVTAADGAITAIDDRRGEAFLLCPDASMIGLSATPDEIDQALSGVSASVTAEALDQLTGGPATNADDHHRHQQMATDEDAETAFRLSNSDAGSSANVALRFDLPAKLPGAIDLLPDAANGFLRQRFLGETFALVGTVHVQSIHEGELAASVSDRLVGIVPADGAIDDVVLSIATNIESSTSTDGVSATVRVDGVAVTTTDPQITSAAGTGVRSTASGDGQAAVVRTDGGEVVTRGSVVTLDLVRTAAGSIAQQASGVVVMITLRPAGPA